MQTIIAVLVGLMLSAPVVAQPLVEGWGHRSSGQGEAAQVMVDLPRGKAVGAIRRLTSHSDSDRLPSWSPNGRHIAFHSDRDGDFEIYVMDSDGDNLRRLTNSPADDYFPSWSPNGRHIAFHSNRDGNLEIYVMDSDGDNLRRLTNNSAWDTDLFPSWSPNGRHIAFSSNRDGNFEIYVMDSDGDNLRRLTSHSDSDRLPSWSPDGRHIAFHSDRDGDFEIYMMDSDGDNLRRLTNNSADDYFPSWSPNGRHIAFHSDRDGNFEIYVMDSDGDNPHRLTNDLAQDWNPSWSPNGRHIAFSSNRDGNWEIYMMELILNSPKMVLESQIIDDNSFGWSEGNANGVVEVGEQITFTVILRNEGDIEAENVKGILSAENRSGESIIVDGEVDYGNIGVGSSSGGPSDYSSISEDLPGFKLKIPFTLTSHDATFILTVTADNGGPWTIPITVPIISLADIGIAFPKDLISEEAFGTHSTYFILTVQHPTLTDIPIEAYYRNCEITLHIPDGTQAFMFPIRTREERMGDLSEDLFEDVLISMSGYVLQRGGLSDIVTLLEFFAEIFDLQERDLKIEFPGSLFNPGRPDTELEYVVLLKNETRPLNSLDITIKQAYHLGESSQLHEIQNTSTWNFSKGWAAARAAHPLALSDYLPFQLLPLEAQQYLLRQFSALETAEASRLPAKTVVEHNYPNPFNPETWISYQLAESSEVTVSIYSVDGRLVRRLALGYQTAGVYHGKSRAAYWDGRNEFGEHVASGVYFYTFVAGNFSAAGKMLMMK